MPPKSRAPAKLTAAQLTELDVIDLCSCSSEDKAAAADPHAALEPQVEPPCWQPARIRRRACLYMEQVLNLYCIYISCAVHYTVLADLAMLAPLPPAPTKFCVDEAAEHAVAVVNCLWCICIS